MGLNDLCPETQCADFIIIARKNGHMTAAKMLKVFSEDDWRGWAGNLPQEAKWLRISGRSALGRKVRVMGNGAGNEQWIEGEIDDYDPLRGLHHVQFQISTAGSWEGWFTLDDDRCRLIDDDGQTMTMMKSPSPPKSSRNVLRNGGFRQESREETCCLLRYYTKVYKGS